jgi:hypothetical protein
VNGGERLHSEYSQQYPAAEGGYSYGTTSDGTVDNNFNYTEGWTKDWITGQNPSQVTDRMNGSETLNSNWDYGTPQTFTLNQTVNAVDGFGSFAGDYNQGPAIYQGPSLPTNKSVGGGAWQTAPGGGPSLLPQMPANNGVSLSTAMTHQAVNGGSSSFSTTNTTPPGIVPNTSVAPTGTYAEADPHLTACFDMGTPVEMEDRSRKAIEKVEEGETVIAVRENDPEGKPRPCKVKRVYHNAPRPLLAVTIDGKTIYCTFKHPYYVRGRGWIAAEELKAGDKLRAPSGEPVIVEEVKDAGRTAPVFNLEIEGAHTYFVAATAGGESVLVHNVSYAPNWKTQIPDSFAGLSLGQLTDLKSEIYNRFTYHQDEAQKNWDNEDYASYNSNIGAESYWAGEFKSVDQAWKNALSNAQSSPSSNGDPNMWSVPKPTAGDKAVQYLKEAGNGLNQFTAGLLNLLTFYSLSTPITAPQFEMNYAADPFADEHQKAINTGINRTLFLLTLADGTAILYEVEETAVAGNGINSVGALEDWEGRSTALDRLLARDSAWEADNALLIHGNSAQSLRTAYLYRLETQSGQFLKWGISQNIATRYPKSYMTGKNIIAIARGSRAEMLAMERGLVETQPGPLNFERWAGSRLGAQP